MIGALVGEYRIIDRLGAGGMGEVFRGVHSKIGRVVAVKALSKTACDPSFVDRFYNEARIQANLHHPNIAALYDFLQFENQPCIIMEYIEGQTLTDRIQAFGSLNTSEATLILQALADAIQYMHSQGIIHRDIKSSNVKITPDGQVKLLDFGIAKSGSSPALTVTGGFVGTLQYLAPELFKGSQADARSDIWALGVLFYEMVTGQMAFSATTLGELYEKVCRAAYVPAPVLNPSVPRHVEAIISRCLKKSPAERYQSASEILRDLRADPDQKAPTIWRTEMSYVTTILRRITGAQGDLADRESALRPADLSENLTGSRAKHRRTGFGIALTLLVLIGALIFLGQAVFTPTESIESQSAITLPQPGAPSEEKTISVELFGAPRQAEVYKNGSYIGMTPCEVRAHVKDKLELEFRLEGFIQKEELVVEHNKNIYPFHWKKND